MLRTSSANVDDAFEWFVLLVAIVSAIMSQYPEYFYYQSQQGRAPSLLAAAVIVPPLVITIMIWLVGKLASNRGTQAVARVIAWMFVMGTTWANLTSYMIGIVWAIITPVPRLLDDIMIGSSMIGFFLVPPFFTYLAVVPRYRELYPESAFLRSRLRFLIAFILTSLLLFALFVLPTIS